MKVVQRQLGHADAAMTLNVYAGLFEADLDRLWSHSGPTDDSSNVVPFERASDLDF